MIKRHIIEQLKLGKTQAEIAANLKLRKIKPNSLSSVEKMLKTIKIENKADTMFHLGFILANQETKV